jgi:hypothetical protein
MNDQRSNHEKADEEASGGLTNTAFIRNRMASQHFPIGERPAMLDG